MAGLNKQQPSTFMFLFISLGDPFSKPVQIKISGANLLIMSCLKKYSDNLNSLRISIPLWNSLQPTTYPCNHGMRIRKILADNCHTSYQQHLYYRSTGRYNCHTMTPGIRLGHSHRGYTPPLHSHTQATTKCSLFIPHY